jgi:ABC-type lipopolysaccharide export system ATPase subunit
MRKSTCGRADPQDRRPHIGHDRARHERRLRLADRISVLVYGQIIASDAPAKIKANAEVQQAYLGTVAA